MPPQHWPFLHLGLLGQTPVFHRGLLPSQRRPDFLLPPLLLFNSAEQEESLCRAVASSTGAQGDTLVEL